jgi:hypothetical protein
MSWNCDISDFGSLWTKCRFCFDSFLFLFQNLIRPPNRSNSSIYRINERHTYNRSSKSFARPSLLKLIEWKSLLKLIEWNSNRPKNAIDSVNLIHLVQSTYNKLCHSGDINPESAAFRQRQLSEHPFVQRTELDWRCLTMNLARSAMATSVPGCCDECPVWVRPTFELIVVDIDVYVSIARGYPFSAVATSGTRKYLETRDISVDATVYYHNRSFSFLLASMSEVPQVIRRLLRRLITSLPPELSPWESPNRPQNDILGFEDLFWWWRARSHRDFRK